MKSIIATALAAASVAVAQLDALSNLPECGIPCFIQALGGSECDDPSDFECQCSQPSLQPAIQPCLNENCEDDDILAILQSVQDTCAENGVEVDVSTPAGLGGGAEPTAVDDDDDDDDDDDEDEDADVTVTEEATATETEVVEEEVTETEEVVAIVTDEDAEPLSTDAAAPVAVTGSFLGLAALVLAVIGA